MIDERSRSSRTARCSRRWSARKWWARPASCTRGPTDETGSSQSGPRAGVWLRALQTIAQTQLGLDECGDGLGVADLSALDHCERFAQGHVCHAFDDLIGSEVAADVGEAGGNEEVDHLVAKARASDDRAHGFELARGQTDLLAELARCACEWGLAGVELPGGDLPKVATDGVTVLP